MALVLLAVILAVGDASAAAARPSPAEERRLGSSAGLVTGPRAPGGAPLQSGKTDETAAPRLVAKSQTIAADSARGAPGGQGRQLVVQVTAYSASEAEGTAWRISRTGVLARPGTAAVDPAVIPLGSRLRISGLPGLYRAEDTGSGVRGAHVDVFMESRAAALTFGRRTGVVAEILD